MSLYRRKPQPLGKVLQDFFDTIPNKKQIKRALCITNWNEIVGERIALETREVRIEGTKLIVFMKNSLWRHEVHAQRYIILNKLNQSVGEEVLSEIIVKE